MGARNDALAMILSCMDRTDNNIKSEQVTAGDYLMDVVMELVRGGEVRMSPLEYIEHYDFATDGEPGAVPLITGED